MKGARRLVILVAIALAWTVQDLPMGFAQTSDSVGAIHGRAFLQTLIGIEEGLQSGQINPGGRAPSISQPRGKCPPGDSRESCEEYEEGDVIPGEVFGNIDSPSSKRAVKDLLNSLAVPESIGSDLQSPTNLLMVTMNMVEPAVAAASLGSQQLANNMLSSRYISELVLQGRFNTFPEHRDTVAADQIYHCFFVRKAQGWSEDEAWGNCTADSMVAGNRRWEKDFDPKLAFLPVNDPTHPLNSGKINPDGTVDKNPGEPGDSPANEILFSERLFNFDVKTSQTTGDNYKTYRTAFRELVGDVKVVFTEPEKDPSAPGNSTATVAGTRGYKVFVIPPTADIDGQYLELQTYFYALITHVIYRLCVAEQDLRSSLDTGREVKHNPYSLNAIAELLGGKYKITSFTMKENFWQNQANEPFWAHFKGALESKDLISLYTIAEEGMARSILFTGDRCDYYRVTAETWEPTASPGGRMSSPIAGPPSRWWYVTPDESRPSHPKELQKPENRPNVRDWHRISWFFAGKITELHMLSVYHEFEKLVMGLSQGVFGQNSPKITGQAMAMLYARMPELQNRNEFVWRILGEIQDYRAHLDNVIDADTGLFIAAMKHSRNSTDGSDARGMSAQPAGKN